MKKNKVNNDIYELILVGGNRLKEDGPITEIYQKAKIKKIKTLIITDKNHLNKLCKNIIFENVLKKLNITYKVFTRLNINNFKKISNNNTIVLFLNCPWKANKFFLEHFKNRVFNYHAATLPDLRGAANISWKILMKDNKSFSINIHYVTQNYDDGRIILDSRFKLNSKNKLLPVDYLNVIQKQEKIVFNKFINFVKSKKFPKGKIQNESMSFYWPRLNSEKNGKINWDWKQEQIILFIRAFSHPFDGAFTKFKNYKIKIYNCFKNTENVKFHPYQNGLIYRIDKNYFYLVCGSDSIKIKKDDMILPKDIENINMLGKRLC